jgi:hypothetical protein
VYGTYVARGREAPNVCAVLLLSHDRRSVCRGWRPSAFQVERMLRSRGTASVSGGMRLLRGTRVVHVAVRVAVNAGCSEEAFPRLARTSAVPGQPGEAPRE